MNRRTLAAMVLLGLSGSLEAQLPPASTPQPALPPSGGPLRLLLPSQQTPPPQQSEIIQASFQQPGAFPVPSAPRPLPPAVAPTPPVLPENLAQPTAGRADVLLPAPERKIEIESATLTLKRFADSWQLWAGRTMLRNFGNAETEAREALRVIRELKINEWAMIGSPIPVVEYGLQHGRATVGFGIAKFALPIDLKSVRVDRVKGVWVLRDDNTLLFNFGSNRSDAEQAVAVVQKYGFDRVGYVGQPNPVMAYFFVAPPGEKPFQSGLGRFDAQAQMDVMMRTGIPVPGLGFVGEMVRIDSRKVEIRREGYEWVLAHGTDVIARFGPAEWQARDALKVVQDGRFTEWCRFAGVSFFLSGGRAPVRVPFATITREFSEMDLAARQVNGKWYVTAANRPLFEVTSLQEGEDLIRMLRHYGFTQVCQTGNSAKASLSFLAKSR